MVAIAAHAACLVPLLSHLSLYFINQDFGQARDLLTALGKISVTLDILTKTRVGLTVNNLRKSIKDDEDTSALAKDLIKKWKKLIDNNASAKNAANSQDSNGSSNGASAKEEKSYSNSNSGNNSNDSTSLNNSHSNRKPSTTPAKPSYSSGDASGNEIRNKCREMLANALKVPLPEAMLNSEEVDLCEFRDADELAEQIEEHIFKEFRNTENKYKNRIRSRVANLKDNRNPDLRLNVLRGIITSERIAKMDSTVSDSVE